VGDDALRALWAVVSGGHNGVVDPHSCLGGRVHRLGALLGGPEPVDLGLEALTPLGDRGLPSPGFVPRLTQPRSHGGIRLLSPVKIREQSLGARPGRGRVGELHADVLERLKHALIEIVEFFPPIDRVRSRRTEQRA
jgi:hypothetical protein